MSFQNEKKYCGHLSQLFDVKEYRMVGGRADGLRAVDIDNGAGLCVTVLADRAMDIGRVTFKGINMNYCSPTGYVAPQYYDERGAEWLRSFGAGFLTTCGLSNIGSGCEINGTMCGIHGRIANIPAEQFSAKICKNEDGTPYALLEGKLRLGVLNGENFLVTRQIKISFRDNTISLNDTIENLSCRTLPYMHLYHFNLGYPLIDEDARVFIPSESTKARSDFAQSGYDRRNQLEVPVANIEEMCYYHMLKKNSAGMSGAGVYNDKKAVGAFICFEESSSVDRMIQWKMMGEGDYVLGLEPANAWVEGQVDARETGVLKYLNPGEIATNSITVKFVSGEDELDAFRKEAEIF